MVVSNDSMSRLIKIIREGSTDIYGNQACPPKELTHLEAQKLAVWVLGQKPIETPKPMLY